MTKKNWVIAGLCVLVAVLLVAVTALTVVLLMKDGGGSSSSSSGGDKTAKTASSSVSAPSRGNMTVALPNDVKLELVKVEAGTFTMGSPSNEDGRFDNETQHQVTLTRDYYIGKTEVTQAQYKAVMGNNPSYFKGDDLPVDNVSWNDAMAFCKKLNEMGKAPSGWQFTLPTEAQWEYAARGGIMSNGYKYSGSGNLDDVAWYDGNSGGKTHPVASKRPNELGLYDMSGNVWEWCRDWYGSYEGDTTDPTGPATGSYRVIRGGSWSIYARFCRSANRSLSDPGDRCNDLGFRLALVPVR